MKWLGQDLVEVGLMVFILVVIAREVIGGSSVVMRAPTSSEVASQFNSYGGTQITASMVSNIRANDLGGYSADIAGANNTVSSGGSSHTSNTVSGFSGVLASKR